MKPLHIGLLLAAGAAGGALVMTIAQRHQAPAAPAQVAQVQPQTPAVPPAGAQAVVPARPSVPPAAPEITQPATAAARPSPWEAPKPGRTHTHPAPPKAGPAQAVVRPNPEPVEAVPPTEPPTAPPTVQETPAAPSTPPARVEPENATPPPPPPPEPHRATLNAGILISVRLIDGLNAERNRPGDTFTASLDKELVADGFVVAERGARVEGRVTDVDPGGRVRGVSTISVALTRLHTSDGQTVAIQTDPFQRRAQETHGEDAAKIGAGAAIGAAIGAIAGGGKGAAIGAGAGGAAGTGAVLATRGKPAEIPTETHLSLRLTAPVTLTERR